MRCLRRCIEGIVFLLALAGPGCRAVLTRHTYTQIIMGVDARIILYGLDEESARNAANAAFDRMDELDAAMSDYRSDSELMRLCERAGMGPVAVSEDLLDVLTIAHSISERSGGAFDVTVGPLVGAWRAAMRSSTAPSEDAIGVRRRLTGYSKLTIDPHASTITLAEVGMGLDLGGIGKGFAAREAVRTLGRAGVERCLVDLGGDIAVGRRPPDADGWLIRIERPAASLETIELLLERGSVAQSGDTARFVAIDGVRYSHIIDPRSGQPLTVRRFVTVAASDGAVADGLASAVSVLGVEALALDELLGESWVSIDELGPDGVWRTYRTGRSPQVVE